MKPDARRTLIGVMGHVDHGKTALVRTLTGMETDRLPEEKRRGISIALGFAYLTIGNATIDFIDMPGHERFVHTMVAGATGVDATLLVIAANEGIKPQTIEHLDVASLLGLTRVIVAISKADLVTPAQAAAVVAAAAAMIEKAGLQMIRAVLTSVTTGTGLDELRSALLAAIPEQRTLEHSGFPYLPIDRVFSVPGHGTIVTGTLRRGALAVSDPVALAQTGAPLRLRGLQVHGNPVTMAQPGQRVAANLRNVEVHQVGSGMALTAPGALPPSIWLTVTLRAVESAKSIPTLSQLVLLFGTEEVEMRLRLLDCDELQPGGMALAQLKCVSPVCVPARERFIIRQASPPQTIGGGCVIDPAAVRLRRHAPGVIARLARLAEAEPAGIVAAVLQDAGPMGATLKRLAQLAALSESRTAEILHNQGALLGRSRVAVLQAAFDRIKGGTAEVISGRDQALSSGQLAALLPWAGPDLIEDAVTALTREGKVVRANGLIRWHKPQQERDRADLETQAARQLAEALRRGGLSPPDLRSVAAGPQASRLVDRLVREGVAVRAADKVQKREVIFHQDAIDAAKQRLRALLANGAGVSVSEAGLALGISRKFSVPLLEHLDAIRFTRRVADRRVLHV